MFRVFRFIVATILLVALAEFLVLSNSHSAKVGGGDIMFTDTKDQPHVLFSHAKHQKADNKCFGCHVKIFKLKTGMADKGGRLKMDTLKAGKFCGTCHNGKKAFNVVSDANCKRCHSIR